MNLFLGMIVLIFLIAGIYFVVTTPSKIAKTKVCLVNDYEINCSDFPGDEHFCKDGVCRMNGICGGTYETNLECIRNISGRVK